MKYYTYIHTRIDKNQIFYVGIGTKSNRKYHTNKSTYYRAFTKKGRNQLWKNLVLSINENYNVEIVFESDFYEDCKNMEISLIKEFGKKIDGGILCNITDGGDGTHGIFRKKSKESVFSKLIYQFDPNGFFVKKWDCGKDIERDLGYCKRMGKCFFCF